MASVAVFIVVLDVLKYGFGIDPVSKEMKQKKLMNKKRKKGKRPILVIRYLYVHTSITPPTATVEIRTVA